MGKVHEQREKILLKESSTDSLEMFKHGFPFLFQFTLPHPSYWETHMSLCPPPTRVSAVPAAHGPAWVRPLYTLGYLNRTVKEGVWLFLTHAPQLMGGKMSACIMQEEEGGRKQP